MDFTSIFVSSVVTGLVAVLVTLRVSKRKIVIEQIFVDQDKWRSSMRQLGAELILAAQTNNSQKVVLLCAQLEASLSPLKQDDQALLNAAIGLVIQDRLDDSLNEFWMRMALLLNCDRQNPKSGTSAWILQNKKLDRDENSQHPDTKPDLKSSKPSLKKSKELLRCFLLLSLSGALLFVLSISLFEEFKELVRVFNDSSTSKPLSAWGSFLGSSVMYGCAWLLAYLSFKNLENWFLEIFNSKSG